MSNLYIYHVEQPGKPLGTAYNVKVKDARALADFHDPQPWPSERPRVTILREGRGGRVTAVLCYPGGPA